MDRGVRSVRILHMAAVKEGGGMAVSVKSNTIFLSRFV
jgi:hypothetical protein